MTIAVSAPCTDLDDHVHQTNVGADSAEAGSPVPLDVALLTRRMTDGDEAAYRTFYDRYFNRLSRYLLAIDPLVASLTNVQLVQTAPGGGQFREIDDDELLALAEPKPAALVRLGPHRAELVVLNSTDQEAPPPN